MSVRNMTISRLFMVIMLAGRQGLIGALEGLSLQVEPVPLAILFERSKIYIYSYRFPSFLLIFLENSYKDSVS